MNDYREPLIFPCDLPLHKQLRLKRLYDEFSQPELAAIIGCGVTTICEVENGNRRISPMYLEKIRSYIFNECYKDKEFTEYIG